MFGVLEAHLLRVAESLPLEMFVAVASFIEEVIAPIPSPTVMTLSGTLANVQGYTFVGLLFLSVVGALGKTTGAVIVYAVADKLEDVILERFGKFFGVTKDDVLRFSKKLSGKSRDYVLMTAFRAAPFIPSSVVSVGSGLLKIPMRLYLVSTFLGTILRDSIYLLAGYMGLQIIKDLLPLFDTAETVIELSVAFAIVIFVFWLYKKRNVERGAREN